VFLVRSVRAPRSGPFPRFASGRVLRAASSSADGCSGDLRCGPTPFASLGGRASAEARLRTQLGRLPLHVTNPKPARARRPRRFAPWTGPLRRRACAPSSVACRCMSPTRSRTGAEATSLRSVGRASAEARQPARLLAA